MRPNLRKNRTHPKRRNIGSSNSILGNYFSLKCDANTPDDTEIFFRLGSLGSRSSALLLPAAALLAGSFGEITPLCGPRSSQRRSSPTLLEMRSPTLHGRRQQMPC